MVTVSFGDPRRTTRETATRIGEQAQTTRADRRQNQSGASMNVFESWGVNREKDLRSKNHRIKPVLTVLVDRPLNVCSPAKSSPSHIRATKSGSSFSYSRK